jgi:hypothetical protein
VVRPKTWRAFIPCAALITLPLVVSCGASSTPAVANIASAPKTPAPTPTATPAPVLQIGDGCVIGTWTVVKTTFALPIETKQGKVVIVDAAGGVGMVEHLFANGTAVENLTGTPLTGSGHGYRVVVKMSGVLRSPVVFINGYETLEPIDVSQASLTASVNGGPLQVIPFATYGTDAYTCNASSLTVNDGNGTVFTYKRTSSTP